MRQRFSTMPAARPSCRRAPHSHAFSSGCAAGEPIERPASHLRRRKLYDETGSTDDELLGQDFGDLYGYFRAMFKVVAEADVLDYSVSVGAWLWLDGLGPGGWGLGAGAWGWGLDRSAGGRGRGGGGGGGVAALAQLTALPWQALRSKCCAPILRIAAPTPPCKTPCTHPCASSAHVPFGSVHRLSSCALLQAKFRGSDAERKELLQLYERHRGDMAKVFDWLVRSCGWCCVCMVRAQRVQGVTSGAGAPRCLSSLVGRLIPGGPGSSSRGFGCCRQPRLAFTPPSRWRAAALCPPGAGVQRHLARLPPLHGRHRPGHQQQWGVARCTSCHAFRLRA
jgi:hypothetical protein